MSPSRARAKSRTTTRKRRRRQFTTPATRRRPHRSSTKTRARPKRPRPRSKKTTRPESWKKVAKKYSEDPTHAKTKAACRQAITRRTCSPEPLNANDLRRRPSGEVEGPVKYSTAATSSSRSTKGTPETSSRWKKPKRRSSASSASRPNRKSSPPSSRDFQSLWNSRTFCADDYVIERCANFKGDGRPAEAHPACYEANPKAPAEACPAPVFQLDPGAARARSASLKPQGKPLAAAAAPPARRPAEEGAAEAPSIPQALPPRPPNSMCTGAPTAAHGAAALTRLRASR